MFRNFAIMVREHGTKGYLMRAITVLSVVLVLLFSTLTVAAQTSGICPGVVEQALTDLGTNCASMSRNSACYGFNNVIADFNVPVADDFFTTTNERAELLTIDSLETSELDLQEDEYGVSLMNVQANLPGTLPGQGVIFVLVGGTKVANGVGNPVIPETTLDLNVTTTTDLLTYPGVGGFPPGDVVGSVAAGSTFAADAVESTGGFVRGVAGGVPGWIAASATGDDVSSLTVVDADSKSPMQAFFFRTGIGGVTCDEVPAVLAVQGPENASVDITSMGVNVRIQSTIVLQTLPPGAVPPTTLQITTLSGMAIINPDTANQILLPPGFTINIPLGPVGEDGFSQTSVGDWSPIRPLTQEELDQLEMLELIPANVLSYHIDVPTFIQASGVGSTIPVFFFADQTSLDEASVACSNGQLPTAVCQQLGL
jgi:hypothetical protein